MARVGETFAPGTAAPEPGFYQSTKSGQNIAIAGNNTLPPVSIAGEKWKLIRKKPK